MQYDLSRFKIAQENSHHQVLKEIKNGKKSSHWMWYVFPQIRGLGRSSTAKRYEIQDIEEARQYISDAVLGARIIELTEILLFEVNNKSAREIFGYPDFLKFHSSVTLFHLVAKKYNLLKYDCFKEALIKYFDGKLDQTTVALAGPV